MTTEKLEEANTILESKTKHEELLERATNTDTHKILFQNGNAHSFEVALDWVHIKQVKDLLISLHKARIEQLDKDFLNL